MAEINVNVILLVLHLTFGFSSDYGIQAVELTTPIPKPNDFAGFGESCDDNKKLECDSTKFLQCVNGACICLHPNHQTTPQDTMFFEGATAKCVVRIGKPCTVQTRNSSSTLLCEKNSKCDPATGLCFQQRLAGESCTNTSDCSQDMGLVCLDNSCDCSPNISLMGSNGCVGKAGSPCINDMCVENAECVTVTGDKDGLGLGNGSGSGSKLCKCIEEFLPTPHKGCAKGYGIDCNLNKCKPWFHCGADGSCGCPFPQYQIFDNTRNTCVSKVNGECNSNLTYDYDPEHHQICVAGAECVKNSDDSRNQLYAATDAPSYHYHCRCKKDLVDNKEQTCDLPYGSACQDELSQPDDHRPQLKCSTRYHLICVDEKCDCDQPLHFYDESVGTCVGVLGARCLLKTKGNDNPSVIDENLYEPCMREAKCEPEKPEEENATVGTCLCKNGDEFDDLMCGRQFVTNGTWQKIQWLMIPAILIIVGILVGLIIIKCVLKARQQGNHLADVMFIK